MKTILFSSNMDIVDEWEKIHNIIDSETCYDFRSLKEKLESFEESVLIVDYDTVAQELNKLIFSNSLPQKVIVLERVPELVTGKMLISRGIKAYGNSRMLHPHFKQMLQTVVESKVWTYPQLTSSLINLKKKTSLSEESLELINNRLSQKEKETIHLVLQGFTNDAIANELNITTRTVKAHVSSIFSKLHVNDRIALILLLR